MPEAPPVEIPPPSAEAPAKAGWFARLKAGLSRSTAKLTESVVSLLHKRRLDEEALPVARLKWWQSSAGA
jgi:fused signal recognition particle receptor